MATVNNQNSSWISKLATHTLLFFFCFGLFCVVFAFWGRDQWVSPRIIERNLRLGMSPAETEWALSMASGDTAANSSKTKTGVVAITLSDVGLGAWFVPQYRTVLIFNQNKLEKCICQIHYRMDKYLVPLDMEKQ